MESYETLLKGGKNGPVLIDGKALDSPVIQRLLLPLNDEDHMPPTASRSQPWRKSRRFSGGSTAGHPLTRRSGTSSLPQKCEPCPRRASICQVDCFFGNDKT